MTNKETSGSSMTITDIKQRVASIKKWVDDPEKAHQQLDLLYVDVLKAIVEGVSIGDDWQNLKYIERMAVFALKAEKIEFPRWKA